MGLITGDSRGQLFSLDLLFALIPLVLVLGMVASDMDSITYLVQDTVYRGSNERVAADTLNTLLETSGNPNDWEETNVSNRTVGLAQYDFDRGLPMEGTLSSAKLATLTVSDVQNIVGNNYGFYFNVTTINDSIILKSLGTNNVSASGSGINSTASDIVRVERVANYAKLDVVSSIKNVIKDAGVSRVYSSPPAPFPTDSFYLDTYDYYVLIMNNGYTNATVSINGNTVIKDSNFNGSSTLHGNVTQLINSSFLQNQTTPQDNSVSIKTVSSRGASMDVYIIQAPKGTDQTEINLDNIKPKPCRVLLYLWTN